MTTDTTLDETAPDEQNTEASKDEWLNDPEQVKEYIGKLRKENATHRVRNKEANTQLESMMEKAAELDRLKEEQAKKNGEFEELYKAEKERADKLSALSERVKLFEDSFTSQYEDAKKELSAAQSELIDESGMSIEKKLEWANKLKAENGTISNSPSSERPGGSPINGDAVIDQFRKGSTEERASILFDTKKNNPKLYETLLHIN